MGVDRLHIALDVGDGGDLIVGFVVVEGVFELALKFVVRREGVCPERSGAARRA